MSAVSPLVSRLSAAVGVVAMTAALIAGCGRVKAPASGAQLSAVQAIRLAARSSSQVRSMTATETATMTVPLPRKLHGLGIRGGKIRVTTRIAMQFRPRLRGEFSVHGAGITSTVIITPRAIFMRWPGPATQHLHKPWVRANLPKFGHQVGLAKLFGTPGGPMISNPLGDARLFQAATHVHTIGTGTVDGVPATGYAGTVTLGALKSFAPSAERDVFALMGGFLRASAIPFTVWVDGQHHIRKLAMTVDLHLRGHRLSVSVTLNVTSINQPVTIKLPPASQVAPTSGL